VCAPGTPGTLPTYSLVSSSNAHLFAAATPPDGKVPADTLQALHAVAGNAAYQPDRLFALLDEFYPVPPGETLRPTPFSALPELCAQRLADRAEIHRRRPERAGQDHVR
jgi:hypothetical protein